MLTSLREARTRALQNHRVFCRAVNGHGMSPRVPLALDLSPRSLGQPIQSNVESFVGSRYISHARISSRKKSMRSQLAAGALSLPHLRRDNADPGAETHRRNARSGKLVVLIKSALHFSSFLQWCRIFRRWWIQVQFLLRPQRIPHHV
jgi:hypothetical protein